MPEVLIRRILNSVRPGTEVLFHGNDKTEEPGFFLQGGAFLVLPGQKVVKKAVCLFRAQAAEDAAEKEKYFPSFGGQKYFFV